MTPESVHEEIKRLRATIEQHEARAREHVEERGALHSEMARVTAEMASLRRRMETMPPWEVSTSPTDEEMRALRSRWAFGPERYQADADSLIAAVIVGRRELREAREDLSTTADALTAAREDVSLLRARSREAAATIERLTRELAAAQAFIREHADLCDECCVTIAARVDPERESEALRCDDCAKGPRYKDLKHAEALRAARGEQ